MWCLGAFVLWSGWLGAGLIAAAGGNDCLGYEMWCTCASALTRLAPCRGGRGGGRQGGRRCPARRRRGGCRAGDGRGRTRVAVPGRACARGRCGARGAVGRRARGQQRRRGSRRGAPVDMQQPTRGAHVIPSTWYIGGVVWVCQPQDWAGDEGWPVLGELSYLVQLLSCLRPNPNGRHLRVATAIGGPGRARLLLCVHWGSACPMVR